ncbi:MAG: hypothetical protein NXH75_07195 [Halobacteriovoraceae bacterium]|nr:hypothetical protein [Halobacteriovoraceae bacterium]
MKAFNLAYILFSLIFCSQAFGAKAWRGYLQGDYTNTDNPEKSHGFQLRRINLIFNRAVSKTVRAFADIEYEDGAELSGNGGEGEIKISRGFAEFRVSRDLKIAAGKFLTPFGYYNEIHDFSASYIPVDPPSLIYGSNKVFQGNNSKRLHPKYSTGLRFKYTKESLTIKTGVANGGDQTNAGTDANKTPMGYLKTEYKILDNSTISLSYIKEKVNTRELPKWEDHVNSTINIELFKYFLISEFGLGNTRDPQSSSVNQNYLNQSHLVGLYIGDSYALYLNYQQLSPDRDDNRRKFSNYSLGINYLYNYFTILKFEAQQLNKKDINLKEKFYTQQLSISMIF